MSQVSHELRTPLNAILGFAQLMAMDQARPLDAAHQERLQVVQHSGRRLLGLIDQLLEVTRIEQGKRALRAKSVNMHALVKRCVDALQIMALERGVDIEVDVDVERPDRSAVRADPDALEQVLANLLSNAIKYNRQHGRVRISFRAGEAGELSVEDTGKGLSESQLGRLFEPFNRLDAEKSPVPGTGLGLVITKQLVETMGGRLEVRSKLGHGSRFAVLLPLARRSRDPSGGTLRLEFPSQWDTGREYSVLYIEDDEINQVLMEQVFSTQPDWRLHCAGSGTEGLTAAVREHPDVILLDINLPDIPGTEVFRRLQADPRTRVIPCVAVSADALPSQVSRLHALGFEDYWTKPLDLPATIGKLKRLLR
jgi:CheY-like chemotaxis protein